MGFLGIDTSNYTTSAAVLTGSGEIIQLKTPLFVEEGTVGLRQSDAVFSHVKRLGTLLQELLTSCGEEILAVGVSAKPRDEDGSYMPCFLAGKMCAQGISAALKIPLYELSHQAGHIAAAIYDTKADNLFHEEFLAFHISGGTTQCLHVKPNDRDGKPFSIETVSQSLDLHAGQLVDRVGAMLGLKFPSGPELESLALKAEKSFPVKIAFKGLDCCLSGAQNQCERLQSQGEKPCDIAKFCLDSIERAVTGMTERAVGLYPGLKLLYAGGVMSNSIIRQSVMEKYGRQAYFASPAFSADNAAGIAVLCEKSYRKAGGGAV